MIEVEEMFIEMEILCC